MSDHLSIETALAQLKNEKAAVIAELMRRGTMSTEIYAPKKTDQQKPHTKDEIYVIASGYSTLYREGHRIMCFKGDILFVAAEMNHRFEDYSEDFSTWVISYGAGNNEKTSGQLP